MKVYSCSFFLLFLGILCVIPVQAGKNKGNLSNLVCFVRFLDEDNDEMFEHPFSMYEQLFNDATSGANSVYNYFREASYGQLSWKSSFYPKAVDGKVISYRANRGYKKIVRHQVPDSDGI